MKTAPPRTFPPPALLPEMMHAQWRRWMTPFRVALRRNWFYRRLLKGPLSDRVLYHPVDVLPRSLEDAEALLRGRYRFAGQTVEGDAASIFEAPPPSAGWAQAMHGFAWLPPLALASGEAAQTLAAELTAQWLRRHAHYSEPEWLPHVTAQRLFHLFTHGRLIFASPDVVFRSKLFVALREQARMLARIWDEAPDGLPRFEAAAAVALSGACLDDSQKRLDEGLEYLESEITRQIFADGGHVSRSPEALMHAYRLLTMVSDALAATHHPAPPGIRSGHDRMGPMVRFFRHGDGALATFQGSGESDARMIAALLARDEVRGLPLQYAPHSGYQRLAAQRSLAVMDCGAPPASQFSNHAHASCLAFEFGTSAQRIVVNCGSAPEWQGVWSTALRATAAHSTLTVDDISTARVLALGAACDLLGPRLVSPAIHVETTRLQTPQGASVTGAHDGYVAQFGVRHQRTLTLSPQGLMLSGADKLTPQAKIRRGGLPFAVRFHIHPDVRVSPSQGSGIILKLPNGEGWRFRASGGQTSIEESVYFGNGAARKTDQLVISGAMKDAPAEIGWLFEQISTG